MADVGVEGLGPRDENQRRRLAFRELAMGARKALEVLNAEDEDFEDVRGLVVAYSNLANADLGLVLIAHPVAG